MNITLESRDEWFERVTKWHRHFALIPCEVGDGEWRWLCWVETKLVCSQGFGFKRFWRNMYRDPEFSLSGWPKLDRLPPPPMPRVKAARPAPATCHCRNNTCAEH